MSRQFDLEKRLKGNLTTLCNCLKKVVARLGSGSSLSSKREDERTQSQPVPGEVQVEHREEFLHRRVD